MKRNKVSYIIFTILILLFFIFFKGTTVYALDSTEDYLDDFDYSDIQKVIDDVIDEDNQFNFSDYVNRLVTGEEDFSISNVMNQIKVSVVSEIKANFNIIIQLIGIAVVAAIFTNFSNVFQNNQVAETGFYITYLLLFTMITASFYAISVIASRTLSGLLTFMKALLPTYFLSITFAAGTKTSLVFYESTLFLITLVDVILLKLLLPMVNIYLIVNLANNLTKEDLLSKLADLLEFIITSTLKSLLALVVGFNTIQGLIVPVTDNIKNSLLLKASTAIPGIGNSLEAVSKTVFGAGILVKNAIGVAGLIIVIVICAVPIIKLVIITVIYKIGVAVVQPISDKRILNCITATSQSSKMLLHIVLVGAILFILTITIILASTNFRLFQ